MFYFVPSWYGKDEKWKASDLPWYLADGSYEFDDTANQLRMFREAEEEITIIALHYAPMLSGFLHRQSLYPVPVISVFDILQGIGNRNPVQYSYKDLPWPVNTEWVFTPYKVLAYVNGSRIAGMDFSVDGYLLYIDYYREDQVIRRDCYDDRGFLSSSIAFENGVPALQTYYDVDKKPQFTEDLATGNVIIAKGASHAFLKTQYDSLDSMIEEALTTVFQGIPEKSVIIIASDARHNDIVFHAMHGQRAVLSYFQNRYDLSDEDGLKRDAEHASLLISDTQHSVRLLRKAVGNEMNIEDISPFDTHLSLGKSQRIKTLRIFMPVDGFTGVFFERALVQVFDYMRENQNVELLFATTKSPEQIQKKKEEIQNILDASGYSDLVFGKRLRLAPYQTETDLYRILTDVRLILDVRDQPDLYLQIAGISTGIPQINYRFTRYVDDRKNGYIIKNITYLKEALEYYLSQLSHWNEALMYCVVKVRSYTGDALVQKWKEYLNV